MAVAAKKKSQKIKKTVAAKPSFKPKAKAAPTKKPVAKAVAKAKSVALPRKPLPRPSAALHFGSANNGAKVPSRFQAVLDKSEITDLVYSFARAMDRLDETLLRSACHHDATLDLGPGLFQGTVSDYIPWILGVLQQARATHHLIGNVRVQLEGDVALVESYGHIHYRFDKPTGREDVFMGVRFLDRFERRPAGASGIWKIAHRKQVIDWVRTEPVSDIFYHQNPDALWSSRTKADPSSQMEQFPGSQSGGKLPAFLGRRYESRSIKF